MPKVLLDMCVPRGAIWWVMLLLLHLQSRGLRPRRRRRAPIMKVRWRQMRGWELVRLLLTLQTRRLRTCGRTRASIMKVCLREMRPCGCPSKTITCVSLCCVHRGTRGTTS